jgi:PAS domain S-box-containing protein
MDKNSRKEKILVVDDTLPIINMVKTTLESEGYEVIVATSGEKAVIRARLTVPDLILLDILMPGIDGYETCKQLKADEKTGHIPVIFMSALTGEFNKVKGFSSGAVDYVVKPIETEELLSRVRTHITIGRLRKELEETNAGLEERVLARTEELHTANLKLQQEISKRQRVEDALREEQVFTDNALDTITDVFIVFDLNGTFIRWNKVVSEITGYSNDEISSMKPTDFFAGKDIQRVATAFESVITEGRASLEAMVVTKDGRQIPFEYTGGLLTGPNGNPLSVCIVGRDLTERKGFEKKLRQVQKMEAIATLAGGIAHDFNNILFSISGYTELCLENIEKNSSTYNHLKEVLTASQRANDLVKQILTFSRQSEQDVRPISIVPVIKEALKLLTASLPSTIEIKEDIPTSEATIMGDPTQVHQILMNLGTNAAHAMRPKGGTLTVKVEDTALDDDIVLGHEDVSPEKYLKLTISDTGVGMDHAQMERIFDPYFTTKEATGGTGLGLAVVHGIVKKYGGFIEVQSDVGVGTTFQVFLPKVDFDVIEELESKWPVPKGDERILFVDDEKSLAEVVGQMLKSLGYDLVTKTSSIDAYETFLAQPEAFDLVITDMTMPHMTGSELAKKLLALRPDIPIILCTGFSEIINDEQAKDLGIKEFVMKPVLMRNIAETIRRVLDGGIDN